MSCMVLIILVLLYYNIFQMYIWVVFLELPKNKHTFERANPYMIGSFQVLHNISYCLNIDNENSRT